MSSVHLEQGLVTQDARVVDQHVEATELALGGVDDALCPVRLGHVAEVCHGAAARGSNLADDSLRGLLTLAATVAQRRRDR